MHDFFGWLVTFVGIYLLIQLAVDGNWWALFITVALAGLVAAMMEWLFGSTKRKRGT